MMHSVTLCLFLLLRSALAAPVVVGETSGVFGGTSDKTATFGKTLAVDSKASNGQYEIVCLGGSTTEVHKQHLDFGGMTKQGFKLIGAELDKDRQAELWIRKNSGQSKVDISGNAWGVPYGILTLSGDVDLDGWKVDESKDQRDSNGKTPVLFERQMGAPPSDAFSLACLFWDDLVELKGGDGGLVVAKEWTRQDSSTKQIGDGDGFGFIYWKPGVTPPDHVDVINHDKGGRQTAMVLAYSKGGSGNNNNNPGTGTTKCGGSTMSDVEKDCGGCAAIVSMKNYGNCNSYCQKQGLSCVRSWDDEQNEQCSPGATHRSCGHQWFPGTSDAICECKEGNGNTGGSSCSTNGWESVKDVCSKKTCAALVSSNKRTCNAYCKAQGLSCQAAWEENANDCDNKKASASCSTDFKEKFDTSDMVCQCQKSGSYVVDNSAPSSRVFWSASLLAPAIVAAIAF